MERMTGVMGIPVILLDKMPRQVSDHGFLFWYVLSTEVSGHGADKGRPRRASRAWHINIPTSTYFMEVD